MIWMRVYIKQIWFRTNGSLCILIYSYALILSAVLYSCGHISVVPLSQDVEYSVRSRLWDREDLEMIGSLPRKLYAVPEYNSPSKQQTTSQYFWKYSRHTLSLSCRCALMCSLTNHHAGEALGRVKGALPPAVLCSVLQTETLQRLQRNEAVTHLKDFWVLV